MDQLVAPLGLRVPPEARVWWGWHNGARDAFILTTGGKAFYSLERCVAMAVMMREIAYEVARPYTLDRDATDRMAHEVWDWDWLPLTEDGLGGILVLDAAQRDSATDVSPVDYRDKTDGDQARPVAPSIGALVQRWIEVIDLGAVTYDRHGDTWVLHEDRLPDGFDSDAYL